MRKHQVLQMLAAVVVFSALGIAIALSINWFPTAASKQADQVDHLYRVLLVASVPVFVMVETVVLFSVWKFRMRPGEELKDGPPIHGNTRLEVVWTIIPAVLLLSLCSYAAVVLHRNEKKGPNEMHITVTAQQFAWKFAYPDVGGVPGKPVQSLQLYVPINRAIDFDVHTLDVIHDFFVPSFGVKTDAVPGITTHTRATPTRLGTYPIACAELCGLGHSTMRSTVHVLTAAKFNAWVAAQKLHPEPVPLTPPATADQKPNY